MRVVILGSAGGHPSDPSVSGIPRRPPQFSAMRTVMIGKDQRPDGPAGSRITVWLRTRFWLRDQGFSPVERLAQRLPPDQLATAAASLSGDAIHEETARAILAGHGLDESALPWPTPRTCRTASLNVSSGSVQASPRPGWRRTVPASTRQ